MVCCAAEASCGNGLHDADQGGVVMKSLGPKGGEILLKEGTLKVFQGCLTDPADITLRRYVAIGHGGAIGPVFELKVPDQSTFQNDPDINIATSSAIASATHASGDPTYGIGFLVPSEEQWFWGTTTALDGCEDSSVCGAVQIEQFKRSWPTVLEMAIVQHCGNGLPACPSRQVCNGNACQDCAATNQCNS